MADPKVQIHGLRGEEIDSIKLVPELTALKVMEFLEASQGVPVKYQRLLFEQQELMPTGGLMEQGVSPEKPLVHVVVTPEQKELEMDDMDNDEDLDVGCLRFLLRARADPNGSAVNAAIHRGDTACLAALLEARADPGLERNGWLPLGMASFCGHDSRVQLLLKARADPLQQDSKGDSALHLASLQGQGTCVCLLLEARADPLQKDLRGETALLKAARYGFDVCIRLLLEARADVLQQNLFGDSALHLISSDEHISGMSLLLEARADPLQQNSLGKSALDHAADHGHDACVNLLLESRADPGSLRRTMAPAEDWDLPGDPIPQTADEQAWA